MARLQVYSASDHADWQAQVRAASDDDGSKLRRMLQRIPSPPLFRPLGSPPEPAVLDDLEERFPNFSAVIECIRDAAHLCRATGCGMRMPPILLVGEPGLGKTAFPRALAAALALPFRVIGMAHATAGFVLGGMDAGWSNAQPGLPFRELVWGAAANPIIVLDEIDKAAGDERHSPIGPLYSLLEPSTARRFSDEMITLPIDCSAIVWLATANDTRHLPAPLLSRFEVFTVAAPAPSQLPAVFGSVWRELLHGEPWWGAAFAPELPPATLAALASSGSPRDAAKRLRRAASRAARGGRRVIEPEDLRACEARAVDFRPPIGFIRPT